MKDSYFKSQEKNDYTQLFDFNKHTNLFDGVSATTEGYHTDAIAVSNRLDKRVFNIELKHRNCNITTYPTVYIEDYKLASMLLDYHMMDIEPLYFNFYNDGVAIFNLSKLTKYPKVEIKNIYSEGKEKQQQQERRYCLDLKDAAIYKQYNLIKKCGEEWKTTKDS